MTESDHLLIQQLLAATDSPSVVISPDYTVIASNKAYNEKVTKPVTIGHSTCHELSHNNSKPCDQVGKDCPLKNCQASGLAQRVLHIHQTQAGPEYCDIVMQPIYNQNKEIIGYQEIMSAVEHASEKGRNNILCGRSPAFRNMLELINRVAPTNVSVLLQGESGTGKELAAQAIHRASHIESQPFVVVECTGLTETLFESELFGYRKGAFTGAQKDKPGLIDAAQNGTLFLDEVGDIPLPLQVKLLRLLETGTYRPVGSVETRKANFRLISASLKNLPELVKEGLFREDLYYRLAAFPIYLPALRERLEDLPMLCNVFLSSQTPHKQLSPAAQRLLASYHFPGNIRELRNILQRAYLMADDLLIEPHHLSLPSHNAPATAVTTIAQEVVSLKELENRYLRQLSQEFTGSSAEMAMQLGISERTLYRKLKNL